MNFLTLLLPTGATASTGPGSKTGTGEAATGFEQLLFGLLGAVPQAAGGQVQSATGQIGAVANAATAGATAALLNGTQAVATAAAAAQTVAAPVGLVEAATNAATAGLTAAQTTTGEAGKTAANATGAVSEALLKSGLTGTSPQQQTTTQATTSTANAASATVDQAAAKAAAQTVQQTVQQVAATVDGGAKTVTTTAQQAVGTAANTAAAAQKAAETTVQNALNAAADAASKAISEAAAKANAVATDAVNKALGTPAAAAANAAATGTQTTTAAAATGVVATAVKPAGAATDAAGDTAKKPEATPASLITNSPEVTAAKDTIKSAVIQAPTADAGNQGATSGKEKDANSNAARLRANRTAAPLAGETVAQQAQAATAKAAQHPSATPTTNASKPAESFSQQVSAHSSGTVDATPILGSGSPGTPNGIDGTGAANAAARHGAAAFTPPAQQVALQFSRALASGSDHITIRLEPASLGRVDVHVQLTKDGHLSAAFVADRPETLDMLQRDARVLERALSDAGLRADSGGLSFNLRGDGGGSLPQFANQPGGSGTFSLDTKAADDGNVISVARQAALNADALLDIRV